ncbi:DUF871 domain-containing protein [Listeria ivanovii]|nr:DUF871 domain-containing protein [Listeria ivanovii]QDA71832.1 DUF871 domain-containing protein [Listeria ivanovii]
MVVFLRGFSVYLPNVNYNYIETMLQAGWEHVFTSLHVPEHTIDRQSVIELFAYVSANNGKMIVDVSPLTRKILQLDSYADLAKFGVQNIRLDDGFSMEEILQLQQDFTLIFNASVLTEIDLKNYQAAGVHLDSAAVMHNFYPHEYTGLSEAYTIQKNQLFHKFGLRTQGFIAGDSKKRGPIFEGLPTVELLRATSPSIAYIFMSEHLGFDDVFIGDYKISNQQRQAIDIFEIEHVLTLQCTAFSDEIDQYLNRPLSIRKDLSEHVIRFFGTRATENEQILPKNTIERPVGSITLDNQLYGRYAGELQIVKLPLPADKRVNVISSVICSDMKALSFISANTPIYLTLKERE